MNLVDFDEETIGHIHRIVDRFKNFTFAPDACDWKWLRIDGACFDAPEYEYYVYPLARGNFYVQVGPIGRIWEFGVWFERTGGRLETQPYRNGLLV
jgi:hypothetical protein